jgi:hypothetical protein
MLLRTEGPASPFSLWSSRSAPLAPRSSPPSVLVEYRALPAALRHRTHTGCRLTPRRAYPCRICAGTGLTPPTSAPRLGSRACHIRLHGTNHRPDMWRTTCMQRRRAGFGLQCRIGGRGSGCAGLQRGGPSRAAADPSAVVAPPPAFEPPARCAASSTCVLRCRSAAVHWRHCRRSGVFKRCLECGDIDSRAMRDTATSRSKPERLVACCHRRCASSVGALCRSGDTCD